MSSAAESPEVAASAGLISDTSYRHYVGPLRSHRLAWWVIARQVMGQSLKKRAYWILALFATLPYALAAFQLYLQSRLPEGAAEMLAGRPYASYLYDSYAMNQFWIFLLTLLVGSGIIAGDNATNALQIYLARPLTRLDYLCGKWLGAFFSLALVSLVPSLLLLAYLVTSFHDQELFKQSPYIALQAVGAPLVPAALHASLIIGFSSCFKRAVLAGGYYAGLYFGLMILARLILPLMLRRSEYEDHINTVSHLHVAGVAHGLGQHIYEALPTLFGMQVRGRAGVDLAMPELPVMIGLFCILLVLPAAVAFFRIRAVEVVKG